MQDSLSTQKLVESMETANLIASLSDSDRDTLRVNTDIIWTAEQKGVQLILEVGKAADTIREILGRLGLARGCKSVFAAYCTENFQGWSFKTLERFRKYYRAFSKVDNLDTLSKFNATAAYLLAEPSVPQEARDAAIAAAEGGQVVSRKTAIDIIAAARGEKQKEPAPHEPALAAKDHQLVAPPSPEKTPTVSSKRFSGSKSDEWLSPDWLVDTGIRCLGGINTDPASNSGKTPNVPAAVHHTIESDGLTHVWHGNVFLNPPFSRLRDFLEALLTHFEGGTVTQALVVTPTAPSSAWFQLLTDLPRAHFRKRIAYVGVDDSKTSPNFDTTLFYLGPDLESFNDCFGQPSGLGAVYVPHTTNQP